ncbi:MAG: hypothetical protein K2X93_09715 [Candidatus Obscuribacterales bacterium]|nr:hypothetical protein [Candidatus Obscuribacterales bacterium]
MGTRKFANSASLKSETEHSSGLEQYDVSFAYAFHWEKEEHIREALKVLLCNKDTGTGEIETETKEPLKVLKKNRQAERDNAALEAARIRWLLAINPNTPPPVLDHLAHNAPSQLLERVAEHPRAHSVTLTRLASNEDAQVRAAVAENMNTSMKTIWKLVRDPSPDVRLRLAESYTVPIAVLKVLVEDDNPYVAARAQKTLLRLMREVSDLRTA